MKFIKDNLFSILFILFVIAFGIAGICFKYETSCELIKYYSVLFLAALSMGLNKKLLSSDISKKPIKIGLVVAIIGSVLLYIFSKENFHLKSFHQATSESLFTVGMVFAGNALVNIEKIGNSRK